MSLFKEKKTDAIENKKSVNNGEIFEFETIVEKNNNPKNESLDDLISEESEEDELEEAEEVQPKKVYVEGYKEKADKTPKKTKVPHEGRVIEEIGIFDGEDDDVLDEEDLDWKNWSELENYYKKGTILESIVCGIEPNQKTLSFKIITKYGRFNRIIIPDDQFFYNDSFKDDFYTETPERQYKRKFQMARNCVGSRVAFVIKGMERRRKKEGGYTNIIIASRREAAFKKRQKYFFGENGPEVMVGDIVYPRVISMNRIGCKVEACGVEVTMNMTQLSSSHWIKDCTKEFKLGQVFKAKVKKLELDNKTGNVSMVLSCSDLKTLSLKEGIENAYPGKVALGEVIAYNKDKKIATCVLHGDILAAIHKKDMLNGVQLRPTDKVSVTIHTVDEKNGFVWGSAARIITRD